MIQIEEEMKRLREEALGQSPSNLPGLYGLEDFEPTGTRTGANIVMARIGPFRKDDALRRSWNAGQFHERLEVKWIAGYPFAIHAIGSPVAVPSPGSAGRLRRSPGQ